MRLRLDACGAHCRYGGPWTHWHAHPHEPCSVSCPQWDAKFSDWLERVQDEALNARFTNPSRRRPPRRTPLSVPAPAAVDPVALNKLIEDLLELENYIPWNAVVSVWGCKRAAWARRVRACTDLLSVIRQIIALEESMCPYAFDPAWRKGDRDNWRVTLLSSTVPKKVGLTRANWGE